MSSKRTLPLAKGSQQHLLDILAVLRKTDIMVTPDTAAKVIERIASKLDSSENVAMEWIRKTYDAQAEVEVLNNQLADRDRRLAAWESGRWQNRGIQHSNNISLTSGMSL